MADVRSRYSVADAQGRTRTGEYDEGLRSHMLGIYNYMSLGVALTGIAAAATAYMAMTNPDVANLLYRTPLRYVLMFAPLGLVMWLGFGINRMSVGTATGVFFLYAALVGVSLSSIFLVFKLGSIAQCFFVAAAAFGATSLYGYTTKRDLTSWGSFLFMGVIGILLAIVVNMFLQSSALQFAISIITVLVFTGLTAYDSQRLKDEYYSYAGNAVAMGKATIMGALSLYLNFINIFMSLLNLFGSRE
jgi:uncharacterized protein